MAVEGLYIVMANNDRRFFPGMTVADAELAAERGYLRWNNIFISTAGAWFEILKLPEAGDGTS